MEEYDFAVIGGGSAGYAGARTAAALGLRTVVIDGADELGGLCILRGCMPSKTLIETANRALSVRRGAEFGLNATLSSVDTAFIRSRKRRLIGEFASYRQGQLADGRFALIRGTAAFAGTHELRVTLCDGGEKIVRFRAALVATGSVISVPDVPGLRETGFWTSDTVLDAAEIPASFVVLGGGAIALEMAHFLEGIGKKVTLIQRSGQLLSSLDADVAAPVEKAFRHRGMTVHTGTNLIRISTDAGGKKRVEATAASGETIAAEAEEILLAVGRTPATGSLDADRVGLSLDKKGHVLVGATQQSNLPHIFAAGDVAGPLEVVHIAIQQAEIAARNAAALLDGRDPAEKMDYRLKLFGVFSHPEVASVGLTEKEAADAGRRVVAASYPFDDHGKSMVMGETEGFVKLIADAATGEIVGGAVTGPSACELIHEIVVAMHFRATARDLATIPHYHPTLSEIWTYPAEELADRVSAEHGN